MSERSCLFVSDLHGREDRYESLFRIIAQRRPAAVFLGGDLLPHLLSHRKARGEDETDFVRDFLEESFGRLRHDLGRSYPRIFLILGNDDPRSEEEAFLEAARRGVWEYAHGVRIDWDGRDVYGYACVPPTPFRLKDWERYDVSRYVDPGSYPPEEGWRTVPHDERETRVCTIQDDLAALTGNRDLSDAIFLFHAPPYRSALDRAALDGMAVDHVPLDVHVGSIAVRRFIDVRQPRVTLHGHVHESARLTGTWREQFGRTWAFSAAHDGSELAVVAFDPDAPEEASRDLV